VLRETLTQNRRPMARRSLSRGQPIRIETSGGTTEEIYTVDIHVMNADGSGLREVADDPALDRDPA
jgi:hypothetical protein